MMSRLRLLWLMLALASLLAVFSVVTFSARSASFVEKVTEAVTLYLPTILNGHPLPETIFGVEFNSNSDTHFIQGRQAGIYWGRIPPFRWDRIEPVRTDPPTYHWEVVDEQYLRSANAFGFQIIAKVQYAPDWAQKESGVSCGPIIDSELSAYAEFLQALVARYSVPPFSIQYWELGNEPDVDPSLVAPDSVFGCWGDDADPYYGGGYYAQMLQYVYPAIKAADPQAQVLIGGLLMDCDPTHPQTPGSCLSGNFFEGIIRNGGGDYFDLVSFHGYAQYWNGFSVDEENPAWQARGGIVMGKIDFLREKMLAYGVDKPILLTEGGLLCSELNPECLPPSTDFFEAQADYVVRLFVRNWAADIPATIWYSFDGQGWRYSTLLDPDGQPKPAYNAYQFLSAELADVEYQTQVSQFPNLSGYEFLATDKKIWVLWPGDGLTETITLPANTVGVYDLYGQGIATPENELVVSRPIYLELTP